MTCNLASIASLLHPLCEDTEPNETASSQFHIACMAKTLNEVKFVATNSNYSLPEKSNTKNGMLECNPCRQHIGYTFRRHRNMMSDPIRLLCSRIPSFIHIFVLVNI